MEDSNQPMLKTPGTEAEGSAIPAATSQEYIGIDAEMVENAPENRTEETPESD